MRVKLNRSNWLGLEVPQKSTPLKCLSKATLYRTGESWTDYPCQQSQNLESSLSGTESQNPTHFISSETQKIIVVLCHSESREVVGISVKFNSESLSLAWRGINAWDVVESTLAESLWSAESFALSERRWGQTSIASLWLFLVLLLFLMYIHLWPRLWDWLAGWIHVVVVWLYRLLHWCRLHWVVHDRRCRNLVVCIWSWWCLWIARIRIWRVSIPWIRGLVNCWAISVDDSWHGNGTWLLVAVTSIVNGSWRVVMTVWVLRILSMLSMPFSTESLSRFFLTISCRGSFTLWTLFSGRLGTTCTSRRQACNGFAFSWSLVNEQDLLRSVVRDIQYLWCTQQGYLGGVHELKQFVLLFPGYVWAAWFFETLDHLWYLTYY